MRKFSKGSSIICTEESAALAEKMIEEINETIELKGRKFERISPPISGGLAMRLASTFGSLARNRDDSRSGSQSLLSLQAAAPPVGTALREVGMMESTFSPLSGADVKTCGTPGSERLKWCNKH